MDPLELLLQSYGIGQDTLVGEDAMDGPGLPPGQAVVGPPPGAPPGLLGSGITNEPPGQQLLEMFRSVGRGLSGLKFHDPESVGARPATTLGLPSPPRQPTPDLAQPRGEGLSGRGLVGPAPERLPWDSPANRTFGVRTPPPSAADLADRSISPQERQVLERYLQQEGQAPGLPAEKPAVPPPAQEEPGQGLASVWQRLLQGGEQGGSKASMDRLDALLKKYQGGGGTGGGNFEGKLNERLAKYEAGYKPLEVPQQTPFDRSLMDKWLELAAPREPKKREWQDLLLEVGLGMTQAAGRPLPRGWAALGPLLAGGAESWAKSNKEQKEELRQFEESRRQYAGMRGQTEGQIEQARTSRADALDRLKIDVSQANQGNALAQMKVGLEIDKAVEESKRGNASLANSKLGILMQAEMFKERIRQHELDRNARLLSSLAKTQNWGDKPVKVRIAPGVDIDARTMNDQSLAAAALPGLLKGGSVRSFIPAEVLNPLIARAQEGIFSGKVPQQYMLMSPEQRQRAVDDRVLEGLQAWILDANNPRAKQVQTALAAAYRRQVQSRPPEGGYPALGRAPNLLDEED